jgi:hypothetical protein
MLPEERHKKQKGVASVLRTLKVWTNLRSYLIFLQELDMLWVAILHAASQAPTVL